MKTTFSLSFHVLSIFSVRETLGWEGGCRGQLTDLCSPLEHEPPHGPVGGHGASWRLRGPMRCAADDVEKDRAVHLLLPLLLISLLLPLGGQGEREGGVTGGSVEMD
jgi:hypothetical protein